MIRTMRVADPVHLRSWRAELTLDFEQRGGKTVLAGRRHEAARRAEPLYPRRGGLPRTSSFTLRQVSRAAMSSNSRRGRTRAHTRC